MSHFLSLVGELESGCDVAIGSRLSSESRGDPEELQAGVHIPQLQQADLVHVLSWGFPDAQCGFKAMTRQAAQAIIPQVQNNNWFFDTELLIIAEKRGYRIGVVSVAWADDPTSTVNVIKTATEDIKGLLRLRLGGIPRVEPPPQK